MRNILKKEISENQAGTPHILVLLLHYSLLVLFIVHDFSRIN